MRPPSAHGRRAIALCLVAAQIGCMTPPRLVPEPAPYLQAHSPKRIWATLPSGEDVVIDAPRLFGDSLLGVTRTGGETREVWVAVTDLQNVRARRTSAARTALAVALAVTVVGLAVVLIPGGAGEVNRECPLPNPEDCEG
jgi:hypothetical protein